MSFSDLILSAWETDFIQNCDENTIQLKHSITSFGYDLPTQKLLVQDLEVVFPFSLWNGLHM